MLRKMLLQGLIAAAIIAGAAAVYAGTAGDPPIPESARPRPFPMRLRRRFEPIPAICSPRRATQANMAMIMTRTPETVARKTARIIRIAVIATMTTIEGRVMAKFSIAKLSLPLLRLWHAALAGGFLVAYLTADEDTYALHLFAGYVVLAAIAVRLLVGVFAPPAICGACHVPA